MEVPSMTSHQPADEWKSSSWLLRPNWFSCLRWRCDDDNDDDDGDDGGSGGGDDDDDGGDEAMIFMNMATYWYFHG